MHGSTVLSQDFLLSNRSPAGNDDLGEVMIDGNHTAEITFEELLNQVEASITGTRGDATTPHFLEETSLPPSGTHPPALILRRGRAMTAMPTSVRDVPACVSRIMIGRLADLVTQIAAELPAREGDRIRREFDGTVALAATLAESTMSTSPRVASVLGAFLGYGRALLTGSGDASPVHGACRRQPDGAASPVGISHAAVAALIASRGDCPEVWPRLLWSVLHELPEPLQGPQAKLRLCVRVADRLVTLLGPSTPSGSDTALPTDLLDEIRHLEPNASRLKLLITCSTSRDQARGLFPLPASTRLQLIELLAPVFCGASRGSNGFNQKQLVPPKGPCDVSRPPRRFHTAERAPGDGHDSQ